MKKRLSVLVLALAMVLTMSASVFAVEKTAATADQQAAADEAKLVKYVKKAQGTTNPTATYKFQFAPIDQTEITTTVNAGTADAKTTTHKTVPAADFPKKDGSTTFVYELASSNVAESAGIEGTGDVKGYATIETIFTNVNFPHAGEYLYEVSELAPTFTPATGNVTDSLTKDSQKFTLHLYVTNVPVVDDHGQPTGETTPGITNVTVENQNKEKVDPTDYDPTPNPDDDPTTPDERSDAAYKADGFTFTDTYTKTIKQHEDPDPEDPQNPGMITNAFQLDKKVTGDFGDKTKKFDFTVTVVLPTGESFDYASKMSGEKDGVTFNDQGVATVKLADSKNFGFSELPVGTKITVAESDYTTQGYKAVTYVTKQDGNATEVTRGYTMLVGEKGASAIATNESNDEEITPTGIIINNLPYVLLIGIALGGIVLFSRKRRYE